MRPNNNISSITKKDTQTYKKFITLYSESRQPRTIWRYVYFLKKIPLDNLNKLSNATTKKEIKQTTNEIINYFQTNSKESSKFNYMKNIKLITHAIVLYLKSEDNIESSEYFYSKTKDLFKKDKRTTQSKVKWVKKKVIKQILDSIEDPMYYLLIKLLSVSGLRISEALQIMFGNVFVDEADENTKYYKINLVGIGKGGKTSKRRIPKELYVDIKKFQADNNKGDKNLIFDIKLGDVDYAKNLVGVNKKVYLLQRKIYRVQYYLLKLGLEVKHYTKEDALTPHMFRHSVGMLLYKSGWKIDEIQKVLDHASLETTQIYAHSEDREIDEKYEKSF